MPKEVFFPKERPEQSLGFLFWQATLLWQRTTGDALKKLDLTHVQFVLLAGLNWLTKQSTSVTQTMLAKHAKTDIMMTSKVLRTIEKKGLITRASHSADSRAYTLEITSKGKDILHNALNVVEDVDQDFFSKLIHEKQIFHTGLQNILAAGNEE